MKNKNNNTIIIPNQNVVAKMENDLILLMEQMLEVYGNDTFIEMYEAFKRTYVDLKISLKELDIVEEEEGYEEMLTEEQIAYNRTLN